MAHLGLIEAVTFLGAFCFVGWMSSRRIRRHLRPFERMGDQVVAIGSGQLDQRVSPADPDTELGRVGHSVNLMLTRLEHAFNEQRASEGRLRRFVADASHELRTPLSSIRGYAELFRRGAASRPEDLALAMRRIESEATRMGVLVDELLLLARLDSGRPLDRAVVDLGALIHDAARDALAADARWPVEAAVDEAGGPVHVIGDADRLRQVLANLLSNVRAHTPPGTSAAIGARRENGSVLLEVADGGPGLTERQQALVFERFYRADTSRGRGDGSGGSGLGLSIVASVAEAHGGAAGVRSRPGEGAVFTVRLPVAGSHAGVQSKMGSRVRVRLSSKKPSVPATSSTPSHSFAAASPLGAGETTGPKNATPPVEITGVPTSMPTWSIPAWCDCLSASSYSSVSAASASDTGSPASASAASIVSRLNSSLPR